MRPLTPLLIAAAFAAAGCTRPAEPEGAAFARELQGRVAGQPQSCISSYPAENSQDRRLQHRRLWLWTDDLREPPWRAVPGS